MVTMNSLVMKIGSGDNVMFERDKEMTKKGKKRIDILILIRVIMKINNLIKNLGLMK